MKFHCSLRSARRVVQGEITHQSVASHCVRVGCKGALKDSNPIPSSELEVIYSLALSLDKSTNFSCPIRTKRGVTREKYSTSCNGSTNSLADFDSTLNSMCSSMTSEKWVSHCAIVYFLLYSCLPFQRSVWSILISEKATRGTFLAHSDAHNTDD